jgi:hypothetical protein
MASDPNAGASISRRERYGTGREKALWIPAVLGGPAVGLYGLKTYRWLDDDSSFSVLISLHRLGRPPRARE